MVTGRMEFISEGEKLFSFILPRNQGLAFISNKSAKNFSILNLKKSNFFNFVEKYFFNHFLLMKFNLVELNCLKLSSQSLRSHGGVYNCDDDNMLEKKDYTREWGTVVGLVIYLLGSCS